MSTVTGDQKRRVPLLEVRPGDVFDVRRTPEGHYVLERLVRLPDSGQRSAEEVLAAMEAQPLEPRLDWEELRQQTREA